MGKKIILVDYSPHIRTLIKYFLEKENYIVYDINNIYEAMDLMEVSDIDLFIVDFYLLLKDGDDFFYKIDFSTHIIPLLITVNDELKAKKYLKNFQYLYDLIVKPFGYKKIINKVNLLINQKTNENNYCDIQSTSCFS